VWWIGRGRMMLTDGASIREPVVTAQAREILWEPPREESASVNIAGRDNYEPRFDATGQTMYFVRGKSGTNADIFFCTRTVNGWTDPQPLAAVNTDADEMGPEITRDGQRLYFSSNRAGGSGGYDLWMSDRGADGTWQAPVNLGPSVNS